MARDYLSVGCTPSGEDCAQVGREDYFARMKRETAAYTRQLIRQFGEPPVGARFETKGFPHDFGTYHEVCIVFNDADEAATDFAYRVENEMPESWDAEARAELPVVLEKLACGEHYGADAGAPCAKCGAAIAA